MSEAAWSLDMSAAPRDGTHILLRWADSDSVAEMWWNKQQGWIGWHGWHPDEQEPVGWMAIPRWPGVKRR